MTRTNGGCRCDNCPTCGMPIRPPRLRHAHLSWCSNSLWVSRGHLKEDHGILEDKPHIDLPTARAVHRHGKIEQGEIEASK